MDAFYLTEYSSPVGRLTLACAGGALTGLWIEGQRYFARTLPNGAAAGGSSGTLAQAAGWLDRYFAGERPSPFELYLLPRGSAFQRAVWRLLLDVPYGETTTYGAWAARLGTSPRAVGSAVGRNPISIIIPCHRALGAGGRLTGYAGGTDKKLWLLRHEGAV